MAAPRVLIAIGPSIYAEALAFSVSKHRPRAEVSLLDPSEDIEAEVRHARPHLIVANRVPPAARAGTCFWVEVAEPTGGEGAKALEAKISADGYSPGWRHSWRLDDRPRHNRAQGGRREDRGGREEVPHPRRADTRHRLRPGTRRSQPHDLP